MTQLIDKVWISQTMIVDVTGACQPYVNWAWLTDWYPDIRAVKLQPTSWIFEPPMGFRVAARVHPNSLPPPEKIGDF